MKFQPAKQGVYYEIFVRSFYDSDGDGIGDLRGIIEKLDYLNDGNPQGTTSLGVDAVWIMPMFPAINYHGYDVSDYYNVNPEYGTLDDFRELTAEAHKRGIKVILDMAFNNTGDTHPWFIDAASGTDSPYRDWFIWKEETDIPIEDTSVFLTHPWHERNGAHYLGIYWGGMPDLNYENPAVRKEIIKIGQFWLNNGADGFRLDSARHLYDRFEHSKADPNIYRKNVAWWQEFRQGLNEVNPDAYLVGEIWDTNEYIAMFLNRALDSGFNFELAKRIITTVSTENASGIGSALQQVHKQYDEASAGMFIEAPFLSNHDQNRIMSELKGNIDHAKIAASILLTLPGNPFLYYGEEIGMEGKKPDEQIREPMIWYANRRLGPGQTTWEPSLYNNERTPSVEVQANDPDSLLEHYKKLIRWRRAEHTLQAGNIGEYAVSNPQVEAYIRYTEQEQLLVAHNLSNQRQSVTLNHDGQASERFTRIALATKEGSKLENGELTLPPYSSAIIKPS